VILGVDVGATKIAMVGLDERNNPRWIREVVICPMQGNLHEKRVRRCAYAYELGRIAAAADPDQVMIENPMGGFPVITAEQNRVMGAWIAGFASLSDAPVNTIVPSQWKKKVLGRGDAKKETEGRAWVAEQYPMSTAWSQDLCDAYCIARSIIEMGLVVK
jgi:Holliday junction resolvasome RuvABC endonuclease subunit